MITYTGIYKQNLLHDKCYGNKEVCNNLFIWNKFKSSGFVTAYGEDDSKGTLEKVITSQPTDHYTRTFFLLEKDLVGNIVCLKKRPAAYHILDYVYQLASTYENEKYFGSFWITTYSHDANQIPTLLQNRYISLFNKLDSLGALNNTIIFFYSDHGVLKEPAASFYDERLPMLYMWFPHSFRQRFEEKYYNLQLNQHRLTTHSDLHSTLWDILEMSNKSVTIIPPDYCANCGSLFEVKSKQRRCEDMGVTARWCSCYILNNVSSTSIAIPEIFLNSLKCTKKKDFRILRHHWFQSELDRYKNIKYHVIAIEVEDSEMNHILFEGIVKGDQIMFVVLNDSNTITALESSSLLDNCPST